MDVIIFNNDKEGSATFSLSFVSLSQIKFNGVLFFPAPWTIYHCFTVHKKGWFFMAVE